MKGGGLLPPLHWATGPMYSIKVIMRNINYYGASNFLSLTISFSIEMKSIVDGTRSEGTVLYIN